ncbi:hypothetical protein SPRG_08229 [Saprolegnia parasitica CBS 223.65]|uniref:Uncharacterized protein n=1 Tax=Saprolegnia parasitica (strain CBS 223.65) TaxID=695850 RepID=A0A067CIQ2_SAPPC|nr:hypothetical protein SPRG_08229 [Saprolegnia parasitica CBS 223.65]KDO26426.1 hypothetical protein SPRG_08229 [Saprolegnia parasitica CBS 223.65]|eukprot:XP_012202863.1 hypothetical protein SPRG_08229 [Saprolegnia parasitica CBS 223.65]
MPPAKTSGHCAIAFCATAFALSAVAIALPRWSAGATFTDGIGALCLTNGPGHTRCLQYHTRNSLAPYPDMSFCSVPSDSRLLGETAMQAGLSTPQLVDHVASACGFNGYALVAMVALEMTMGFVSLVVLFNGICFGRLKGPAVPIAVVCNAVAFLAAILVVCLYAKPNGASYDVSWYLLLASAFLYVISLMCGIVFRTTRRHVDADEGDDFGHVRLETPTGSVV